MFDAALSQPYVLEVNLAPALGGEGSAVNQAVHERVLLHTIGMLSVRRQPSAVEQENLRQRIGAWAPSHNFTMCDETLLEQMARERRTNAYVAARTEIDAGCLGDRALLAVWRVEFEAQHMGLFQRIYPDGVAATTAHDHFWLNNAESVGTVGSRGPSLVQRVTSTWVEDFALPGGECLTSTVCGQ